MEVQHYVEKYNADADANRQRDAIRRTLMDLRIIRVPEPRDRKTLDAAIARLEALL